MGSLVLIADDDPDVVEDLGYLLEENGYETASASNGEEALEKIRELRPALVILDLLMPKVDGFAVLKKLREPEWEEFASLPVVVLTSIREEISQRRYQLETGEQMRFSIYLEKPYDHDELLEVVKKLVS
jgi:CheY-like chemotaxis protein